MMPANQQPNQTRSRRTLRRVVIVVAAFGVLGVFAGILHVANRVQRDRLISEARTQGLAAHEAGDYQTAIDRLGYVQSRQSNDPIVTYSLASAYSSRADSTQKELMSAAMLARRAWELDQDLTDAAMLEIMIRGRLAQHTEHLDAARRLLNVDPGNEHARRAEITALASLGRRQEALDSAIDLAGLFPDDLASHRTVLQLLTGLEAVESRRRMREYAESLVSDHQGEPSFLVLAAQAFAQAGDLERSMQIADMLADPDSAAALTTDALPGVVQLLDALAMRTEATGILESLQNRPELAESIAMIQVQRKYKSGRIDEARTRADSALSTIENPGRDLLLWSAVVGAGTLPDPDAFEAGYHQSVLAGLRASRAQAPGVALTHFYDALEYRPTDALAMSGLAAAHDSLGAWVEAQRVRARALRAAPDFTVIRLAHIESLLRHGEPAAATSAARTGLRIDPSHGGLALAYIMSVTDLAERGQARTDDIRSAVEAARELDQNKLPELGISPASPLLARLLIVRGDRGGAERIIESILSADPGTINAHQLLALARSASRSGLYLSEDLLQHVDLDPTVDAALLLDRAQRLAASGQNESGLMVLDAAIENAEEGSPRASSLMLARAAYLDQTGDPRALAEMQRLGTERTEDAVAQTLVLESESAWNDASLIAASIAHLRRLSGEASAGWRIHEALRLQRFEPSEASAAKAVVLLEPVTLESVSNPAASIVLAQAYRSLGDTSAAITALRKAADAAGDRPGVHLQLLTLHQSRGEIEEAVRRGRVLAAIEPVDTGARRERALALLGVGMAEQAMEDAEQLVATGEARDLFIAARVAAAANETTRLDAWLDALASRRDLEDRLLAAASALLAEAGRADDAITLIEAHASAGDTADTLRARAAVWAATGLLDRAIASVRDAYAASRDSQDLITLAKLLSSAGRLDEARSSVLAAAGDEAPGPMLRLMSEALEAGDAGFAEGRPAAAEETLELVRRMLIEEIEPDELVASFRSIASRHPTYFPAWAMLIETLASQNRLEEAAQAALTASRILPSDARPARLAVELMIQLRPLSRAVAAAREWQRRSRPDTYQADTTLAALLVRLDRQEEAGELINLWGQRIASDSSTPPVLLRLYAMQLVTSGRSEEARAIFSERIGIDPRWNQHRVELARDLIRYADAPDAARRWLNGIPDDAWADGSLALRGAQARLDLVSRTARPDDQQLALEAAELARDRATPATERAARLIDIDAHRMARRYAEAVARARNAVERAPGDPMTIAMLVQASADAADSLDAAEAVADLDRDRLLEDVLAAGATLDPVSTQPAVRTLVTDSIGRAYRLAGNAAEAEAAFRRVLAIDADHTMARLGLAEAFVDQGLTAQAMRVLSSSTFRDAMDAQPSLAPRLDRILRSLTVASVPQAASMAQPNDR
ncbi:MAG: tetratricopeptide repeat protein [Planctomycetota bacterium]